MIHPCQATIPYKASGSPHLASYFHIRSAVTDRVFAGSGLECKPACLCHRPVSAPRGTNLVSPPPSSCCTCGSPSCYYYFPTFLNSFSAHHLICPLSSLFLLYFSPFAQISRLSLHHLFLACRTPNTCTHTRACLSEVSWRSFPSGLGQEYSIF